MGELPMGSGAGTTGPGEGKSAVPAGGVRGGFAKERPQEKGAGQAPPSIQGAYPCPGEGMAKHVKFF
jgi:hypothetical protein